MAQWQHDAKHDFLSLGGAGFVEARVDLPYTFATQTDLDGDKTVQSFTSFSLHADVIAGRQPLDCQWIYSEEETSGWSSAGGNGPDLHMNGGMAAGFYTFEAIVTDADGHMDTTWHQMTIKAPDGPIGGGGGPGNPCLICDTP